MKKIALFLICCLVLAGCKKEVKEDNLLFEQYKEYEDKLNSCKEFKESSDEFSIHLVVNKANNNEYRYDVIIDTPTINMYHLQAIVKVDSDKSTSLPTLGILEDEVFSLIPGVIDKPNGIYKGVNLSGITNKSEFYVLVYLTFSLDKDNIDKEERYIRLYGNAS